MEVAVTTDVGSAQRHNEDGWCAEQLHRNVTLLGIADGFGRLPGTTAASTTLEAVREVVRRELKRAIPPRSLTAGDMRQLLVRAFNAANERLLHLAGGDADRVAAASTCSAILIVSTEAFIAHIGDSRVYLLRRGELVQLTTDESIVPELVVSRGGSQRGQRNKLPRPLLTRALGLDADGVAPKVTHHTLQPHDALLFCTDGAYRTVALGDLQATVNARERAEWATDRIVGLGRSLGGVDNATVMFVRDATEHGAPPEPRLESAHRPQHTVSIALAGIIGAAALAMSLLWTADTKLYLGSDAAGNVTLFSGSPASVLGIPLHIERTDYGLAVRDLPPQAQQQVDEGLTVASPAAAAVLVAQWQPKPQH